MKATQLHAAQSESLTKALSKPLSNSLSKKGQQTVNVILDAAEALLVESGYHSFSLRKVAATAGLTVGNLQYHFPSKDLLIEGMLNHCIQRYLEMFEGIRQQAGANPKEQFTALIKGIFKDLNSNNTTMFFPELWSLSNHDDNATESMDAMYEQYRRVLMDVITEINPALSKTQLQRLALFISASIEGHTIFIGKGKPWQKETLDIVYMATQSFLWLIEQGDVPTTALKR
jgi:AcrR family transcriptional regulator